MTEFDCAPILLIGFNRPERLKAQVDRLRVVKPRRLFVAVDGPRPDRPGEAEIVARTRAAVASVDWPCDLQTRFLDANRGCRFAPPEAISWFLDAVGEGVIENPTTWDIQWCVAMAANDWLCVVPRAHLVANVGHEAGASHTGGFVYDVPHFVSTGALEFPLSHPSRVEADKTADRRHANRSAGYVPRALTVWGNVARRSHAARALGGWIVPFAHWVERRIPALFRI